MKTLGATRRGKVVTVKVRLVTTRAAVKFMDWLLKEEYGGVHYDNMRKLFSNCTDIEDDDDIDAEDEGVDDLLPGETLDEVLKKRKKRRS